MNRYIDFPSATILCVQFVCIVCASAIHDSIKPHYHWNVCVSNPRSLPFSLKKNWFSNNKQKKFHSDIHQGDGTECLFLCLSFAFVVFAFYVQWNAIQKRQVDTKGMRMQSKFLIGWNRKWWWKIINDMWIELVVGIFGLSIQYFNHWATVAPFTECVFVNPDDTHPVHRYVLNSSTVFRWKHKTCSHLKRKT